MSNDVETQQNSSNTNAISSPGAWYFWVPRLALESSLALFRQQCCYAMHVIR